MSAPAPPVEALAGKPRRGMLRSDSAALRSERRLGYILIAPSVIALLAVTAFPLGYNVWNSLNRVELANPTATGFVGLHNFVTVLTTGGFVPGMVRTFVYTAVSVVLEMIIGLALALTLDKAFKGRGIVRAAILIPWAVPTVVSAMLWKTMFDPSSGFVDYLLGLLHLPGAHATWLAGTYTAWTAVLIADAWKNTPFIAILLLAGLQVIPRDIYEAARVDGSSTWQSFVRLTLPLLKPAILVALVFRTLSAFFIFDVIYIMTGGGPGSSTETLSYINWHEFLVDSNFGYGGAMSVMLIVMALVIAVAYMRIFRTDA
ncbi:MAG: carbohydrate ABC transporter permease [Acidimicrobiales bacterium]